MGGVHARARRGGRTALAHHDRGGGASTAPRNATPTRAVGRARSRTMLAESGPNELHKAERTPAWRMFLRQFNDFMIWVLLVAVAISAFEGQIAEAIAILAILVLNGVLGFVQEYRAEQALEALKEHVRADRHRRYATAWSTTSRPPSSCPATSCCSRRATVSRPTAASSRPRRCASTRRRSPGESVPARKRPDVHRRGRRPLGDRRYMVFAGTSVAVGRGRILIVGDRPEDRDGQDRGDARRAARGEDAAPA